MDMKKMIEGFCIGTAFFALTVALSRGHIPTGVETAIFMLILSVVVKQKWEDAE